jgi:histidine ammonia-lyase
MAACQAIDLLRPLKSTKKIEMLYEFVRKYVPYMADDYVFTEHIENLAKLIREGEILKVVGLDYYA